VWASWFVEIDGLEPADSGRDLAASVASTRP